MAEVKRPRSRSQARFEELVLPHLDRLVRFACRRLKNPADAEDVVQDACTRAWLGFAQLRDESQVLPWLYRIVRSALSDFLERRERRERLAPMLTLDAPGGAVVASDDPGPLEQAIASITSERLYDLLRRLPAKVALPIELHDFEGLRYREIAELTGVPLGTVMSRIYRGRKALAALIVMDMDEEFCDVARQQLGVAPRRWRKRHG